MNLCLNFAGLAFRGNSSENASNINYNPGKNYFRSAANEGNFIGLVKMMADDNSELAEHLNDCEKNGKAGRRNHLTFLSNNFINSSLRSIRNHLVVAIVNDIKKCGGYFGVIMDGSQDVTCQEQISVAVKYVNQSNDVVERTVAFFNAKSTTGKSLFEYLQTALNDIGYVSRK